MGDVDDKKVHELVKSWKSRLTVGDFLYAVPLSIPHLTGAVQTRLRARSGTVLAKQCPSIV